MDLRGLENTFTSRNTFSYSTEVDQDSTEGTITVLNGGIVAASGILGNKVYSAVWNDFVDRIIVDDDCLLEYGKCYCFDGKCYQQSSSYLCGGFIGIHSDTAGFDIGHKENCKELCSSIAGFVLAYVDKEYPVGTPLTCTENGCLTKIKDEDKREYPERIVATYWKNEPEEYWGDSNEKVKVNNRKWVKIR